MDTQHKITTNDIGPVAFSSPLMETNGEAKVSIRTRKIKRHLVPHFTLPDAQYPLHNALRKAPIIEKHNLTCKEVPWLFYSGQGGGQTVGKKEDRRRNEEQMRSEATAIWQWVDMKVKTTKKDLSTTTTSHDNQHLADRI